MGNRHLTINDKYILLRKSAAGTLDYIKHSNHSNEDVKEDKSIKNTSFNGKGEVRKRYFVYSILSLIIISILFVAAIRNPTSSELKDAIRTTLLENYNNEMGAKMIDNKNDGFNKFGAFMGTLLMPYLIDNLTTIHVSDYIIFSTFDCSANNGKETKTIVSGIVVFGKIIPLKTDLKDVSLEFN